MITHKNKYIFLTFALSIMSLMVATGIGRFVFTPILPIMLEEQTVEMSEVIWLSSANYIGYFVGAMSLFKNHRHLLLMVIGLIVVTIATFLSSVESFTGIFVFRFLTGVAGAWALVSTSAWAIPWLKKHKVAKVGFVYTGVGAGISVSGIVCSLLILQDWSATGLWYAIGTLSVVLISLVFVLLTYVLKNEHISLAHVETEDAFQQNSLHNPTSEVLDTKPASVNSQYPAVWRLALAYGLFGFGYIIPSTFLPKIAKDMVSGNAFLLVWPVFGLASVIVVSLTQKLTHVSDLKIWKTAQIILGLATLLPLLSNTIGSLIVASLLIGGSFMVVIMSILKIAATLEKNYNVVALVTASFALGQLAGPLPALLFQGEAIWNYVLPLSCFASLLGVAFIWKTPKVNS